MGENENKNTFVHGQFLPFLAKKMTKISIFMKNSFSQICFMGNFGPTAMAKLQLKIIRLHCRIKMVKKCENWQFWPILCTYWVMYYSSNAKKAFIWTSLSVLIIGICSSNKKMVKMAKTGYKMVKTVHFSLHIWSYIVHLMIQAFIWTKLGVLMVGHK